MPAWSWSLPSVGDTLWVVSSLSCTGSAPYCSTVARSLASPSLKFPEIWTVAGEAGWSGTRARTAPRRRARSRPRSAAADFGYDSAASWLNARRAVVLERQVDDPALAAADGTAPWRRSTPLPGERGRAELVADRRSACPLTGAPGGSRSRPSCPRAGVDVLTCGVVVVVVVELEVVAPAASVVDDVGFVVVVVVVAASSRREDREHGPEAQLGGLADEPAGLVAVLHARAGRRSRSWPCRLISGSATPSASTRLRMMSTALSSDAWLFDLADRGEHAPRCRPAGRDRAPGRLSESSVATNVPTISTSVIVRYQKLRRIRSSSPGRSRSPAARSRSASPSDLEVDVVVGVDGSARAAPGGALTASRARVSTTPGATSTRSVVSDDLHGPCRRSHRR